MLTGGPRGESEKPTHMLILQNTKWGRLAGIRRALRLTLMEAVQKKLWCTQEWCGCRMQMIHITMRSVSFSWPPPVLLGDEALCRLGHLSAFKSSTWTSWIHALTWWLLVVTWPLVTYGRIRWGRSRSTHKCSIMWAVLLLTTILSDEASTFLSSQHIEIFCGERKIGEAG